MDHSWAKYLLSEYINFDESPANVYPILGMKQIEATVQFSVQAYGNIEINESKGVK